MKKLLLLWILFAASLCAQWPNGYLYQTTATVASGQITGSLTNYPAMVALSSPNLKTAANGGSVQNLCTQSNGLSIPADFLVTSDSAGMTQITGVEFEAYNAASGAALIWVNIASAAVGTEIYIWYDNSSVTTCQGTPSAAWNSSYIGVWHLESGAFVNDSTSNGNTLTNYETTQVSGPPAPALGGMAGAAYSSALTSSNVLQGAINPALTGDPITLEAWAYATTVGGPPDYGVYANYFSFGDTSGSSSTVFSFGPAYATTGYFQAAINDDAATSFYGDLTPLTGWNLFAATMSSGGSSGTLTAYFDGASVETGSYTSGLMGRENTINLLGNLNYYIESSVIGSIAEARLVNTALSAAWLAADYANQSAPGSFWTISYDNLVPPSVISLTPIAGTILGGITVTLTGTNFGSGATVMFGSTAATDVTVVNSTTITAVNPAEAVGLVNVSVTVNDVTGTLDNAFTYLPYPWNVAPAHAFQKVKQNTTLVVTH